MVGPFLWTRNDHKTATEKEGKRSVCGGSEGYNSVQEHTHKVANGSKVEGKGKGRAR